MSRGGLPGRRRRIQWSLLAVGFIVAIPVFLDVAFIILVSVVFGLTDKTGKPIVYYGLPLLAGLAVTHAFIPPTPGPVAVAGLLGVGVDGLLVEERTRALDHLAREPHPPSIGRLVELRGQVLVVGPGQRAGMTVGADDQDVRHGETLPGRLPRQAS